MICLSVTREDEGGAPRTLQRESDELILGRSADADVVLDHDTVSLFHLRLLRKDGALFALDLGSANGSWLDGARLAPGKLRRLSSESRVSLGPFRIEILEGPLGATDTAAVARQAAQEALGRLGAPPRVEVVGGPNRGLGLAVPLGGPPRLVGRGEECHLVLTDADVSRRHLVLCWEGLALVARDAGSKNGFCVNGERVAGELPLREGDELQLGETRLRYVLPAEGTEPAAEVVQPRPRPRAAKEGPMRPAAPPPAMVAPADAVPGRAWRVDPLTVTIGAVVVIAGAAAIVYLLL